MKTTLTLKKILASLNPFYACTKYGTPFWQCPSFIFLIVGISIIATILIIYFIGMTRIGDPFIVNFIILGVTSFLIIIDYIITRSFERINEAYKLKSEFVNVAAHQLRTPLVNIKYSLALLMSNISCLGCEFSTQQLEQLEIVKKNNERMVSLLNNLLTIIKIETQELVLKKEEVSLNELVKKLALDFENSARQSGIKIELQIQENFPLVLGDSYWLKQIVKSLINNALSYTQKGGKIIFRLYLKNKKAYLEVEDTGIGIPEEEQKYIFYQKFFRAQNILKYQTQGIGLSLYIVKKVVKLMKGQIWFKSQENKGTTFYLVFSIVK